jgi:RND family efflux transporter MFP subunit
MDRVGAELEESRQVVAAAEASVARAESGRGAADTALAYGRVTAPFAARVVRLEVDEGSTVLPGTPLLVLDRADGWEVRADVPESRLGKVAIGDPVQVEIPSLGTRLPGRIAEIEPAADPRSRSFRVKAELPPDGTLAAGLFARVVFPGRERTALLVPVASIVERGQLTGVYVVADGVLSYRLVKTGQQIGDRVEILSGLKAGETVVVEGVERARSGARVEG